jgi:hypothetical protein
MSTEGGVVSGTRRTRGGGEDWYRPDQRPQKGELAAPSSFMQRALRKCLVLAGESPRTIRSHVKIFDQAIPD